MHYLQNYFELVAEILDFAVSLYDFKHVRTKEFWDGYYLGLSDSYWFFKKVQNHEVSIFQKIENANFCEIYS